jgi:hypothetical protein
MADMNTKARALRDFRSLGERPHRLLWPALGLGGISILLWSASPPRLGSARDSDLGPLFGFVVCLGLASSVALLGRLLEGSLRDGPRGSARFVSPQKEFGRRDEATAALLVRTTRGTACRAGKVWLQGSENFAYLSWELLSRHVLVVGNTGSGKTTGVFNHIMLSSDVPWIYQDQKAELPLRGSFPERPVWGLDTRGHATRSGVWNPLQEIRTEEDLEVLSALLIPDRGDEYDWVIRSARFLFEALLKAERFESLQAVGRCLETEGVDALSRRLPPGARSVLDNPRQRGYFLEALREVLHPLMSRRVSRVTEGKSTLTLDDFIARGGYVLANEDKNLRASVTLFWGLLLNRLRNRSSEAGRLLLLLDEFGDAGRVPNMASALALYRSKNVAIMAGVQTYSLLKTVYRGEWEAVRDGFGTVFVLTANLPKHMYEPLSRELGCFTVRPLSLQWGAGGPSVSLGSPLGAELVPPDRWGAWGEARACLARGQHPTWWIPCPVPLAASPLGPPEGEGREGPEGPWVPDERSLWDRAPGAGSPASQHPSSGATSVRGIAGNRLSLGRPERRLAPGTEKKTASPQGRSLR